MTTQTMPELAALQFHRSRQGCMSCTERVPFVFCAMRIVFGQDVAQHIIVGT